MTKKITIAIDAMGGENSPIKTIDGVKIFLESNKKKNALHNTMANHPIYYSQWWCNNREEEEEGTASTNVEEEGVRI